VVHLVVDTKAAAAAADTKAVVAAAAAADIKAAAAAAADTKAVVAAAAADTKAAAAADTKAAAAAAADTKAAAAAVKIFVVSLAPLMIVQALHLQMDLAEKVTKEKFVACGSLKRLRSQTPMDHPDKTSRWSDGTDALQETVGVT
jgi:hypothetical protein